MPDIQLRPTISSDLPRLMRMDHSVASDTVWQLELRRDTGQINASFREVRLPRSITVSYPHDAFALSEDWVKRSMMYTALLQDEPVGFISMLERGASSVVWVTDLVVDPERRRQGIASALLSAAQDWSISKSQKRMILEVQSKNISAIRLAQKFGYEFCGYNDQYYITQDVTLFFVRILK